MKNWEDYKLVLALQRAGTIRAAAERLNVNHATVSRHLARVNRNLSSPIFEKVTGGYKATELGHTFVAAAEQIEAVILSSERKGRAVNSSLTGDIRISMGEPIAQYLLKDDLLAYAKSHSGINLCIETSLNLVDLDRSEADIVIRATDAPPDHLVGRRFFPFALCDYGSKDYLETTAYADRKWLRFSKSVSQDDWIAGSSHPDAPVALKSDDLVFLLEAAKAGQGMIRTACYMADPDPDLVRLPDTDTTLAQDFWILTHPDLRRAERIQHMMSYLAAIFEDKRDLIQGRA